MSNQPLAVQNGIPSGFAVSLDPSYITAKQSHIEALSLITSVESDEEQLQVVQSAAQAKRFCADIEKIRKDLKAPYWNAGQMIDAVAKSATEAIQTEVTRIERIVTAFQRQKEEKARIEREMAQREAQRLENERLDRERKAQQEQERLAREQQAAMAKAQGAITNKDRTDAEKLASELEEQRIASELASEFDNTPVEAAHIPEPEKPKGFNGAGKLDFDLIDVHAFYKAYPQFCEVKIKTSEVKAFINLSGIKEKANEIPGLRVFRAEGKIRATKATPAIDI